MFINIYQSNRVSNFQHIPLQQRLLCIAALLLSLAMTACSPDHSTDAGAQGPLENGLSLPLPARFASVRAGLVTNNSLVVEAVLTDINTGAKSRYPIKNLATANGEIKGQLEVPIGSYEMRLEYFLYDSNGAKVVVVTSGAEIVDPNTQAEIQVVFAEEDNVYPDTDNDKRSNLHELDKGTDWNDPNDVPPPDSPFVHLAVQGTKVEMSWANEGGAVSYRVYVSETPITVDTVEDATYIKNIPPGSGGRTKYLTEQYLNKNQLYYFAVKSNDQGSLGDTSTPRSVNPNAFIPREFTIATNNHQTTFSWDPAALPQRANSMNLYMQNSPGVQKLGNPSSNGWMAHLNLSGDFVHGALKYGKGYYFALAARNGEPRKSGIAPDAGDENSALATEVVVFPKDPVGATPVDVGFHFVGNDIELVWTNEPGKSYAIYHSTSTDPSVMPYKNHLGSGLVHKFVSEWEGSPYKLTAEQIASLDFSVGNYFTVTSLDANTAQESAESAVVGFSRQGYLATPDGATVEVVNNTTLRVKWNQVPGADSYTLYMDQDTLPADLSGFVENGVRMKHDGLVSAEYVHGGLDETVTYHFRVTAENDFGESAPTQELTASPFVPPNFDVSLVSTAPTFLDAWGLLTNTAKFDINLIPVQFNRDPSVHVIGVFPPGKTDGITGPWPEGSSVDVQVSLPPDGGEFLKAGNGAGSLAGAQAYYAAVDPSNKRDTFQKWKVLNGVAFSDPNDPNAVTYEVPDAQVMFFNGRDHDLARVITLKRNGGNISFYADHFNNLEDATTLDADERKTKLRETVAIEVSPPAPGGNARSPAKYVKFFAFDSNGDRVNAINLDGRGERFLPEACIVCHAGDARTYADGDTSPYPNQGNVNGRLAPFDLDAFKFDETDPVFNRGVQELEFKLMNQAVREAFGVSRSVSVSYDQSADVAGTSGVSPVPTTDFCTAAEVGVVPTCRAAGEGVQLLAATVAFQEGVVDDVNVSIDFLTHNQLSELELRLVSPAGTSVKLVSANVLGGSAMGDAAAGSSAVFDDEASQDITTGAAPYSGSWKPASPLSTFDGEDASGRWQLKVVDKVDGTTGYVQAWTLQLTLKAPAVELIEGWYGGPDMPNPTHDGSYIPRGWNTINSVQVANADPSLPQPQELYTKVIKESCRVCHLQRGSSGSILDFATWDNFNKDAGDLRKNQRWLNRIENEVFVEGTMPRAFPAFRNFWMSEQPLILATFLRPGSATDVPPSPAKFDGLKGPGNPYMHSGAGKNVDGLTEVGFDTHSEHFTTDASGISIGTYAWTLIEQPAGSNATLANFTSQIPTIIPNVAGTYVVEGSVSVNSISSNIVTDRIFVNNPVNTTSLAEIDKNILKPDCGLCHRAGGPADHTGFLSDRNLYDEDNDGDPNTAAVLGLYDMIVNQDRRIDPTSADASRLLAKPAAKRLPRFPAAFDNTPTHGGGIRPGFDWYDLDGVAGDPNFGQKQDYQLIRDWIDLRTNTADGKPPAN